MPRQFQWNRVSRNLKRVAVLFLLVILIYGIHIKADVWPLLLTGDSVPATANFRFNRFGEAVVNTSGTIAFNATFTTPDNASGDGIFKIEGGKLTPVMM